MDRRDGVLKYSIAVLLQLLVCQLFLPLSADRDVEPLSVRPHDRSMSTLPKARPITGRVAARTPARVKRESSALSTSFQNTSERHPSLSEFDVHAQERSEGELYDPVGHGQCQGVGEEELLMDIPMEETFEADEITDDFEAPQCEDFCTGFPTCIGFTVYREDPEEETPWRCALVKTDTLNAAEGIIASNGDDQKRCWRRASKHVEAGESELHTNQGSMMSQGEIDHGTVGHRQSSDVEDLQELQTELSDELVDVTSQETPSSLAAPSIRLNSSERERELKTPVNQLTEHLSAERDAHILGQEEEAHRQSSLHSEELADQLGESSQISQRVQEEERSEVRRLEGLEKNGRAQDLHEQSGSGSPHSMSETPLSRVSVGQTYEDGLEGLRPTSRTEKEVEPSGKVHVWEKVDGDKFCQTFGRHMVELSQDSPTYVEANAPDHHLLWWMIIGCPIVPEDSEARGSILVTVASSGEHAVMYLKPYEDLTRSFVDWDNAFTLELGVPMNTQDIYQMLNIKGQNLTDIPELENKYCKLTAEFYKVPDLDEKQTMADRVMWRKDIIPILQCCPGRDACPDDEISFTKRFS